MPNITTTHVSVDRGMTWHTTDAVSIQMTHPAVGTGHIVLTATDYGFLCEHIDTTCRIKGNRHIDLAEVMWFEEEK